MDPYAIPEQAVAAFEQIHGLSMTIHDLQGTLCGFLGAGRFSHRHPVCRSAKILHGGQACVDFDVRQVRLAAAAMPEGRIHVCHAGLVEWVVPVFRNLQLAWVLFAGVRLAGPDLRPDYRQPPGRRTRQIIVDGVATVNADEANRVMEHLRQVAARLKVWAEELPRHQDVAATARFAAPEEKSLRQLIIRRFVQQHHVQRVTLGELAEALHLSIDRAGHTVRECCGKTFGELLTEARIQTASNLLRHLDLSVAEVAARSGFEDLGHFHRTFRRTMQATPARYRKAARV